MAVSTLPTQRGPTGPHFVVPRCAPIGEEEPVFPKLVLSKPTKTARPRRRLILALAFSLIAHATIGQIMAFGSLMTALFWVPVESGHSSVELQASIASADAASEPCEPLEPILHAMAQQPVLREAMLELEPMAEATEIEELAEVPVPAEVPIHLVTLTGELLASASPTIVQADRQPKEPTTASPTEPTPQAQTPPIPRRDVGHRHLEEMLIDSSASMPSDASNASHGSEANPPSVVFNPSPDYPIDARTNRWTGRVLLWVRLATDGSVAEVRVYRSSDVESLDQAAIEAVRQWQFAPEDSASPTLREFVAPITFELADE